MSIRENGYFDRIMLILSTSEKTLSALRQSASAATGKKGTRRRTSECRQGRKTILTLLTTLFNKLDTVTLGPTSGLDFFISNYGARVADMY
jgi:hypothetical protein